MNPVEFTASRLISQNALEVSEVIADVESWSDFDGHGIVPGIEKAVYENRTEDLTGSIIKIKNSDGSEHREEILEWIAGERIVMKIYDFPLPLRTVATHFLEFWNLEEKGKSETLITRKFQIFPVSFLTRPIVNQLSTMLKKATVAHLDEMARNALKQND